MSETRWPQQALGVQHREIFFVFKHRKPAKDAAMIARYKREGWEIISQNDDRVYFGKVVGTSA